jgi:hypothetical protein
VKISKGAKKIWFQRVAKNYGFKGLRKIMVSKGCEKNMVYKGCEKNTSNGWKKKIPRKSENMPTFSQ